MYHATNNFVSRLKVCVETLKRFFTPDITSRLVSFRIPFDNKATAEEICAFFNDGFHLPRLRSFELCVDTFGNALAAVPILKFSALYMPSLVDLKVFVRNLDVTWSNVECKRTYSALTHAQIFLGDRLADLPMIYDNLCNMLSTCEALRFVGIQLPTGVISPPQGRHNYERVKTRWEEMRLNADLSIIVHFLAHFSAPSLTTLHITSFGQNIPAITNDYLDNKVALPSLQTFLYTPIYYDGIDLLKFLSLPSLKAFNFCCSTHPSEFRRLSSEFHAGLSNVTTIRLSGTAQAIRNFFGILDNHNTTNWRTLTLEGTWGAKSRATNFMESIDPIIFKHLKHFTLICESCYYLAIAELYAAVPNLRCLVLPYATREIIGFKLKPSDREIAVFPLLLPPLLEELHVRYYWSKSGISRKRNWGRSSLSRLLEVLEHCLKSGRRLKKISFDQPVPDHAIIKARLEGLVDEVEIVDPSQEWAFISN
jgi:hypothetical protein